MPWYELTTDVMVRGTPRATGEVLDLSEADGQLLTGLGRAKPTQAPQPAEPVCPMPKPAAAPPEPPLEEVTEAPTPRLTRRTKAPAPKE